MLSYSVAFAYLSYPTIITGGDKVLLVAHRVLRELERSARKGMSLSVDPSFRNYLSARNDVPEKDGPLSRGDWEVALGGNGTVHGRAHTYILSI